MKNKAMIGFPKKYTDVSEYAQSLRKGTLTPRNMERFLKSQLAWHEEKGFPHRKTEGWRHFPFQKILKAGYVLETFPEWKEKATVSTLYPNAIVLKMQNGRPILPEKPEGFSVVSWQDALKGKENLPSEIKTFVFQALQNKREGLCPLNNALALNGLVIVVEEKLKRPLEIQYSYHTPTEKQEKSAADNLRNFIFLQENAQAQIMEIFYGSGLKNFPILLNLQTDAFVGKKAHLEFIRLDRGEEKNTFFNHFFCELSPEAKAHLFTLSLRSGTSRFLTHLFQQEKSVSEIRGLSILGGGRHTEHQVTTEHLGEKGMSHQFYQSLLFQSARHVFRGMTRIEKPAQKTEAQQLNRNLILGDRALAVSAPELDIKADDVKACHGSSTSSLEENRALLFYLQSRGITPRQALSLILSSLIKETFSPLKPNTQQVLETLIWDHLQSLEPSFVENKPGSYIPPV